MPSWNILHYILAGAIIFALGTLGYCQVLKTRLSLCTARSEAFVAETKAAAQAQIALNTQEAVKRGTITRNLEDENVKLQSDIAKQYADSRRLLNAATSRSRVSTVPTTPESGACRQDETQPVEAVYGFEGRVLDILEQGDKGIAAAIARENWEDKQEALAK